MNKPIVGTIKRRLTAQVLYLRLSSMLFMLNILLKIAPPSKDQLGEMLKALEELRIKLGEGD